MIYYCSARLSGRTPFSEEDDTDKYNFCCCCLSETVYPV